MRLVLPACSLRAEKGEDVQLRAVSQFLPSINKLCGPELWASRLQCDGSVPERFRTSAYSARQSYGRTSSHACMGERRDGWLESQGRREEGGWRPWGGAGGGRRRRRRRRRRVQGEMEENEGVTMEKRKLWKMKWQRREVSEHMGRRRAVLGGVCLEDRAVWWEISAQRMVIPDGLFIQGLQTRPRTSLCLLGLKGPPTTQPNSSHSTLAPISSCLFPSTTQTNASLGKVYLPPPETQRENGALPVPVKKSKHSWPWFGTERGCFRETWCGAECVVTTSICDPVSWLRSGGFILFNQAEASFGNGVELLKSWLVWWLSMVENCLLRLLTNEKVEKKRMHFNFILAENVWMKITVFSFLPH